jgi:hypothetical protein
VAKGMSQATASSSGHLPDRDRRALTEVMTVNYWDDPNVSDHEVAVYTSKKENGVLTTNRYRVNPTAHICNCGDMIHRRPTDGCKHVRRVLFELGKKDIPDSFDTESLADGVKRRT